MALAITLSLDKPLPEAQAAYVKAGQGKSLARESERIDTAARLAKVAAPTSMLSENPAALGPQLLSEGGGVFREHRPREDAPPRRTMVPRRRRPQGRPRPDRAREREPERLQATPRDPPRPEIRRSPPDRRRRRGGAVS